ncbi:hypothetical protein ACVBEQ_24650 [Nakamurella sp. GG22]
MVIDSPPRTAAAPASGVRAHRPLFMLATAMAVLAAVAAVGLIVDDRTITGLPLWAKPLKFALSVGIYGVTFSWLIGQLRRGRRVAWWAGTIAAVLLGVEMVIIVGQALRTMTSHFNVGTALDSAMFSVMGTSIAVVWAATLVISVVLFASPGPDPARNLAIRAGALISVAGMALGFLMTIPTAAQLQDFQGIAGAHTVGLPDGGPGLPLLGWSTVGGDLRIPHFVGMHALQLLPVLLIVLELGSRRVAVLRDSTLRAQLVGLAAVGYAAVVALVTWQALRGQSIVRPDLLTGMAFGAVIVAVAVPAGAVLIRASREVRTVGTVTR